GNWVAVAPRAEPFPNQWQTRVLLWFVLSLLLVGPFIWFFARRIVQPLEQFAGTAETLGRNPGASVVPLAGPAEIGRAARAFNQMQSRLRAFVDDRTMMVGAISHDLRTPLTRMRFRLEDVPDSQRDGLLGEVEEMEEMITQVIGFIRDVSAAGPRETVDLATLVEETVRDARVVGAEIEINRLEDAVIDGDFASLRRVLANL
ncbi:MAG: HAMP domain-containing protein, partial [Alphaproteobacteria bacterium]|nr:HAMP domain-containing protein [Alphaproteobacteria bacterium]